MALTPKEAFEAICILFPDTVRITPEHGERGWCAYNKLGKGTASSCRAPIGWGSINEYPAPEPKWRDARPEDVSYPFKEARFRDRDTHDWVDDVLSGYAGRTPGKWVSQNGASWYMCQVRDEA